MKKSDLKTGMWIMNDSGDKYKILLNTKHGDICIDTYGQWGSLKDINDDLTSKYKGLDIIKIFQPATEDYYCKCRDEDIIWEYKKENAPITNENNQYLKVYYVDGILDAIFSNLTKKQLKRAKEEIDYIIEDTKKKDRDYNNCKTKNCYHGDFNDEIKTSLPCIGWTKRKC